eukprot:UN05700
MLINYWCFCTGSHSSNLCNRSNDLFHSFFNLFYVPVIIFLRFFKIIWRKRRYNSKHPKQQYIPNHG